MIIALLAAAAVAAPGAATEPDWYRRPTAEDLRAVWPHEALRRGIGGKARLDCRVNIHGETEDCHVVSETPPGMGFGAAALLLTPQFLFKPATRGGVAEPSRIVMPITFEGAGPSTGGPPDLIPSAVMLDRPVWAAAPTFADLGAVYPKGAGGGAGYVALRCDVKKDLTLHDCDLVREEPQGKGFEAAARRLVARFRMEIDPRAAAYHGTVAVNLRIRVIDPAGADFARRRLSEPQWVVGPDPDRAVKLFPAAAAAKGLKTGLGVAGCAVAVDGTLTDCKPLPGEPDGLGFSEAAVEIAQVMKMNRWTQEGGPVDGSRLQLPIRFKLADDKPAAK